MNSNKFPSEFNEEKIQHIIEYYENQSEDQAVAEDETIITNKQQTMIQIPNSLVPLVRELIAQKRS